MHSSKLLIGSERNPLSSRSGWILRQFLIYSSLRIFERHEVCAELARMLDRDPRRPIIARANWREAVELIASVIGFEVCSELASARVCASAHPIVALRNVSKNELGVGCYFGPRGEEHQLLNRKSGVRCTEVSSSIPIACYPQA